MSYEALGTEIGKLVDEKNKAYGSSFSESGKVMRILYPNGVSHAQLDDALAIVRVLDKLFRIATAKDAFGESPWRDIAGYALLGAAEQPVDDSRGFLTHTAETYALANGFTNWAALERYVEIDGNPGKHAWAMTQWGKK